MIDDDMREPEDPIGAGPEEPVDAGARDDPADDPTTEQQRDAADEGERQARDTEADILRSELKNVRQEAEALKAELAEAKDRTLRARAELDTFRRRMQGELELARDAGLESVMLPVLSVYDDLNRALEAAEIASDPAAILPGVRAVMEGLERNLDNLGIRRTGDVGETFDPALHEALAVAPATGDTRPGTISQVFEIGFVRGDRLVRPARVVVAADPNEGAGSGGESVG
ncbi:MAG: nucleotide exchange factor GrpE [Trueperaceae bacterium]